MELEHQLAVERSRKEDQLSEIQQRQIDDIILKYKDRIKSVEDEKIAVNLYYTYVYFSASTNIVSIQLHEANFLQESKLLGITFLDYHNGTVFYAVMCIILYGAYCDLYGDVCTIYNCVLRCFLFF